MWGGADGKMVLARREVTRESVHPSRHCTLRRAASEAASAHPPAAKQVPKRRREVEATDRERARSARKRIE